MLPTYTLGRGFAVVADEVKKLASTTTKATEEICTQVQHITESSQAVGEAIDHLATSVGAMQEITRNILMTTKEQGIATQDISTHASDLTNGIEMFLQDLHLSKKAA